MLHLEITILRGHVLYTDVKLLGRNIKTIKNNTEALLDARKKVGLKMNAEKTKYMFISHYWNTG
jgi:hypothetical protein